MDLQLWYLLALPLLFFFGWWARGYDAKVRNADPAAAPNSLSRGLNLLLNDHPDEAIGAFVEIAQLDPGTIELHYALGKLFRQRGEFDRAVRVHSHLLGRADLPAAERERALSELAQDYLKGGMIDRAEASYRELLEIPSHRIEVLRALLRVYSMGRDFEHAIECARALETEAGESHRVAIAHFSCELAERAAAAGDAARAANLIEQAFAAQKTSARARILAGDLAERAGDRAGAIRNWSLVAVDSPGYLPLVADRYSVALDKEGRRAEALDLLRRQMREHPSVDLLEAAAKRVLEWEGPAAAESLLREELQRHPSLLGFERLLALRAASNPGDGVLDTLRSLLGSQSRRLARYRCSQCGLRIRTFAWQCPGCAGWETYAPRRIEEIEAWFEDAANAPPR